MLINRNIKNIEIYLSCTEKPTTEEQFKPKPTRLNLVIFLSMATPKLPPEKDDSKACNFSLKRFVKLLA